MFKATLWLFLTSVLFSPAQLVANPSPATIHILFFSPDVGESNMLADSAYGFFEQLCKEKKYFLTRSTSCSVFDNVESIRRFHVLVVLNQHSINVLNQRQKDNFSEYIIGDKAHSGGALVSFHLEKRIFRDGAESGWTWYNELTELTDPGKTGIVVSEVSSIYPILNAEAPNVDSNISFRPISNYKMLPHPLPGSGYAGGKVFVTFLANSPGKFSRNSKDFHLFTEHIERAVDWASGSKVERPVMVKLLDLSDKTNVSSIHLSWIPGGNPTKIKALDILRSEDGITWKQMATFEENLTSDFWDNETRPGRFYYRIRQTNINGSFLYSDMVVADISNAAPQVEIFPNPIQNMLFIRLEMLESKSAKIFVETREGQKLITKTLENVNGKVNLQFDVSTFPPGIYLLKVSADTGETTERFLKY
ncbi:MAG: T9SS type A sorting domain-containing protein [Bacteroidia bacterium]